VGAMAEAVVAYAQPLLDETDGSADRVNTAFLLAQLCWNLALMAEQERDEAIGTMRPALKMDDDEFEAFRRSVVAPMILRHREMFPHMHRSDSAEPSSVGRMTQRYPTTAARAVKYPGTGRNAPCPCNSGRKYKLCCGR
jgi:hypothetical protein